jgi:hypothetical protein
MCINVCQEIVWKVWQHAENYVYNICRTIPTFVSTLNVEQVTEQAYFCIQHSLLRDKKTSLYKTK